MNWKNIFETAGRDTPSKQDKNIVKKTNERLYKDRVKKESEHPLNTKEDLKQDIDHYKNLILDFEKEINNLKSILENTPTIAQIADDPSRFIDIGEKSKEDIIKIIKEMETEQRKSVSIIKNFQEKLQKIELIIPSNILDN